MKHIWVLILAVGISSLIVAAVYNTIPKTAFVDNQQLFDAFQGRKELENKLEQASNAQKATLDSLGLQIQALQQQSSIDDLSGLRGGSIKCLDISYNTKIREIDFLTNLDVLVIVCCDYLLKTYNHMHKLDHVKIYDNYLYQWEDYSKFFSF